VKFIFERATARKHITRHSESLKLSFVYETSNF